jgi:hypothetical protein
MEWQMMHAYLYFAFNSIVVSSRGQTLDEFISSNLARIASSNGRFTQRHENKSTLQYFCERLVQVNDYQHK